MCSVSYVTCVDIIAQVSLTQWSIFLFLDIPTLKLRIIIIILPTERPDIPWLLVQQKIKLSSPKVKVVLGLSNYATKKELDHAAGDDAFDLAAKKILLLSRLKLTN